MSATKAEISGWFDQGAMKGARWMLVICDTYDHEDYPVYANTAEECRARYKTPGEMQRVMEVYDLLTDKAYQLIEHRAFHLPEVP